ncbi:hypothetical protein ACT8ZV_02855 [Nocardioides sp. MAHUQ-72]|uniref:hypothetical protein n=1 Tax=unclassified Nocardioides TaxID=2615069 RepID=UPI003607B7E5
MPFDALLASPVLSPVLPFVISLVDESPEPEDVKAGWTAFAIFLMLAAAVVVLGFSLVKQLKKAQAAKDAGVYGDEPEQPAAEPENHDQQPR